MESQILIAHQELDSIMGTTTRIPCFLSAEGFPEWKYYVGKYIKMKEFKIWRSILKGPIRITTTLENGTVTDKEFENYTNEDFEKIE